MKVDILTGCDRSDESDGIDGNDRIDRIGVIVEA